MDAETTTDKKERDVEENGDNVEEVKEDKQKDEPDMALSASVREEIENLPPIPPMQNHTLDLRTLTPAEEAILRKVMERDANEMEILDNRISLIRRDIQEIRVRGALVAGDYQNTMCARCKHKFWLIPLPLTDRGVRCIRCKFRICAKCRFKQINNTWLCILCLKYREEKILSGEWMFKGPVVGLSGSDLMRASFRDKGRKRRRSQETTEDSAFVTSTSGSPGTSPPHTNGAMSASSPGAQRRDSYSKALENQKIRVILPKGNDNEDDVDGRRDGQPEGAPEDSTLPMHGGNDDLDDSDNSSLSSHSSIRPISINASTNTSFSSRSSSKSMPTSDNHRAPQHGDTNNLHHVSEEDDAGRHGGNRSSLHGSGGGGGDGPGDFDRAGRERKDSFEEIYDSNVNRLVKMMTSGQVSDSDSSPIDARRTSQRLLPRPPDSGKENDANDDGDYDGDDDGTKGDRNIDGRLLVSLSEELKANMKYLKMTDGNDSGVAIGGGSRNDDDDDNNEHDVDNINRVCNSRDGSVKAKGKQFTYNDDNDQTDSLAKDPSDPKTDCTEKPESLFISDKDIDDVLGNEDTADTPKDPSTATQGRYKISQEEFESFSLEDQSLMLSYLRTPENDIPYEFKASLSRNDSNASDALSRITEVSEPYGEALSREGSGSDGTLNDGELNQSLSDDDEVMNSSKSSVINVTEMADRAREKGFNNYDEDEPKSKVSAATQDDSGLVDNDTSEASIIGSEDSSSNLPNLDDPRKEDMSFSSSVLSEFDLDKDPEGVLKLSMTSASTPTPDALEKDDIADELIDESKDVDAADGGAESLARDAHPEPTESKDVEDEGVGTKSENEPDRKDSVRDSDSGVNSSHTSRANTPEQRSLSSGGDKGSKLNTNSNSAKSPEEQPLPQVPTISVTEEEREEDDDLDELFSQHRPYGSNLSNRSSLRDSRESLYSVYSAAGEEHYGDIPVTGEIEFHLEYNYKTGVLNTHVKQCKELAPVDTKKNRSDPYVKTYLLPDKTRSGKRKTKIKRHTLNPTYNETLAYTISKTELESRTLWLSVWNNDRFGRNDFLGEVTIPLDYYEFDKSNPTWYTLQDRQPADDSPAMTYKGDLFISIKYVPASMVSGTSTLKKKSSLRKKDKPSLKTGLGEIHVLVKEAHNLTAMRSGGGSNPFCKGYLLPDETHHSKQKTPVLKKTTNPNWQHLLVFEGVDETELENHGVELTVWDHETLSSNDFLGGVRLNTGTGYIKGKSIDWMDARGEEIEVWQKMIDRHNEWIDVQLPLRASMGKQKK